MSNVNLHIGGRTFTVACEAGQEEHILGLGRLIDEKVRTLGPGAPPPPPPPPPPPSPPEPVEDAQLAGRLEAIAGALEKCAAALETLADEA